MCPVCVRNDIIIGEDMRLLIGDFQMLGCVVYPHGQVRADLSNILHEALRSVTLIDDALGQGQVYLAVSQTRTPTAGGMDVHDIVTCAP